MQTFGAYLVAALAASSELVAALPSKMEPAQPRAVGSNLGAVTARVRPRSSIRYAHPALAVARAVKKFNGNMTESVHAIMLAHKANVAAQKEKRQTTSGEATNNPESGDVAYITNIAVGTPAQTLPMDFDTGSSDLWVFSSETPSNEVNGQVTYNIDKSSTAKQMTGATWSITYGDGSSSSGNVYTDVVTIGNISVTNQAVESATTVSDEFTSDSSSSGLVGLAMSTLNTVSPTSQNTFFDNAKTSLGSALFTANLQHDAPGLYTFGALDETQFTGDIFYADLFNSSSDLAGFWTFQSSGYTVGNGTTTATTATTSTTGKKKGGKNGKNNAEQKNGPFRRGVEPRSEEQVKRAASTTITGIADTGTTLLMLPDDVVADYYSQVSGAEDSAQEGGYIFSCDADLPDFSFNVGSGSITVPGSFMNFEALDASNTTCFGGMQSDASIGFSIFGDVALKAAYVVFDEGNGRVGWAAKTIA